MALFARHPLPNTTRDVLASVADEIALGIERKRTEEALIQQARALQESESRLRAVLSSTVDGIITINEDGIVESFNPAAERIFGYQAAEAISQNVKLLMPEPYHSQHDTYLRNYRNGGAPKIIGTGRVVIGRRKDGVTFPMELGVSAVQQGDHRLFIGIVRDITERRAVERMKDEFISVVSHELRTPLTSIRGSLGLLAGGLLERAPDKARRMLDIAVANTDRLVRLINDILDIERIESGKVTMQLQSCEAASLMTQAVESVRAIADKAGVTLELSTPPSAHLWADSDRIIQTLTNLLGNAIKFSPSGATVWLSAQLQSEQIVFHVKDQGRGIPEDKLEQIFERFQQVDASDAREKGGTGLGLAICRSIVQQHGGHIWVESTIGQGSTFSFTLPKRQDECAAVAVSSPALAAEPESSETSASLNGGPCTKPHVLVVVEDDQDLLQVMRSTFERHDVVTHAVSTGREAITWCQRVMPDLMVLDLGLPDLDGFAVVEALRQQDQLRQLPVVVYSGRELTDTDQRRLRLGPTRFFTKSRITPEEFEQQVMDWLAWLKV
jgi:PAS domain S-box-containing protein